MAINKRRALRRAGIPAVTRFRKVPVVAPYANRSFLHALKTSSVRHLPWCRDLIERSEHIRNTRSYTAPSFMKRAPG